MIHPVPLADRRKNPRAQLRIPVRIRWRGPMGMRLEVTRAVDVCRSGLLVERAERCEVGSQVWVISPFDSRAMVQPETPGRIARVERLNGKVARVAVAFDGPSPADARPAGQERRRHPRVSFALPIFIRPAGSPWPEESMTQDLSPGGARFSIARIFARGDSILAKIPWGEWEREGEIRGRVVRVQAQDVLPGPSPLSDPASGVSAMLTTVSVQWIRAPKR
ncbi:MAG TPA: PilZ domain-containing protein [Verrucomicrobiae bacterium]|nr:PilZ domain-containing protein [Verrucomicrobiae bacterium]